ncbi:MAG: hypothetical protein ACUVQY_10790 [Thermoproteota archaeon]
MWIMRESSDHFNFAAFTEQALNDVRSSSASSTYVGREILR